MNMTTRERLLLVLCLVLVAGLVLTGCGKKEAALKQPGVTFTDYVKGPTVDFDDETLNTMAAGSQASFMYGIAKAIYPTVWDTYKDTVAQDPNVIKTQPYWRGDGVHTYYTYLSSADQTAVDGYIYAYKLSAAEQGVVTGAVDSFFALYDEETADAKTMGQNTAWLILYTSMPDGGASAAAWAAEATDWMTALNWYAAVNFGGKSYAQLTYLQRKTAEAAVFANGAGTISPEYSFWRIMVKTSFLYGNASARWPDLRDSITATQYPGRSYTSLCAAEKPTVDYAVWTSCNQTAVNEQISGLWSLSEEQVDGVVPDNENIYYTTLKDLGTYFPYLVTDNSSPTAAANNWLADVTGKAHNYDSSNDFYAELKYNHPQWQAALTHQYFGTDNYSALLTDAKALIDRADVGMRDLSIAQRSDVLGSANEIPLTSNIIYQTLYGSVSPTAAAGWAAEVGAGMNRELAFYKWMGYEGFRAGTVASQFYPTQLAASLPTGKTYSTLTACEKLTVNTAVWAALGTNEHAYGDTAMSGMWGKVEAEMTNAVSIDQTSLSMQLRATMTAKGFTSETAAANFRTDVENGMSVPLAFYKWLAKESVRESAAAALLIRESVGEFSIKISNPNKYAIRIDEMQVFVRTSAGGSSELVDGARQVVGDIWVPAKDGGVDGEVEVKIVAPIKAYDIVQWLATAEVDVNSAQTIAMDVFDRIQAGTVVWIVEVKARVSHDDDIQNYAYADLTQA